MKSQRRHELKENVLAHELARLKDLLDRYGNWILGGVVAVGLVGLVVWYYHSRAARQLAEEQQHLDQLRDQSFNEQRLQGLGDLAENARSSLLGAEAAVLAGDQLNEQYLDGMRQRPPVDQRDVRAKAERLYRLAISKYPDRKLLAARAHIGLGVLAETAGDFPAAEREYKAVGQLVDQSYPVAAEAQGRLERMSTYTQPARMASTTQATARAATKPAS